MRDAYFDGAMGKYSDYSAFEKDTMGNVAPCDSGQEILSGADTFPFLGGKTFTPHNRGRL